MKNFERCGHVGDSFELLIAFLGVLGQCRWIDAWYMK